MNQDYSDVEVIVVDDGSTDNSIEVIEGFYDKIIKVLKPNGGQASAFNAGFGKSRGDIIIFLDSDDALLPSAVTSTINSFKDENVAKVHWHLYIMNEYGVKTQELFPKDKMEEGNFREKALQSGPPYILSPPTSGNAWSRKFIDSVIPVPEDAFRICADEYFVKLVTFFGSVKQIDEP